MMLKGICRCYLFPRQKPSVVTLSQVAASAYPYGSLCSIAKIRSSSKSNSFVRASAAPSAPVPEAPISSDASSSAPTTIYSRPELYDVAFSYREFKSEVTFLLDVYKKHGGGAQLTSVLELGCGTGRHLAGLARAGVPRLVGLDMSPEMLAYARTVSAKQGGKAASIDLQEGDMSNFNLPHKSFDMAMCLLGTFSHLLDTQEAISCFRSAAAHLRPGGLFLLELAHPGDLFDGSLIIGESGKEVWERPYNGDKVFVEWGAEFDNFDPVTQIIYRTVAINVLRGEDVVDSVEEVIPQRQHTVRELELLAQVSGFETCGLYGEMRLDVDLEHEEAYRMVAVYRKPVA